MMNKYVCLNGSKLKQLRQDLGLSQEQASWHCREEGIRLSIATIKRAELGKSILYRTAKEFSRLFNVCMEELILDEPSNKPLDETTSGNRHLENPELITSKPVFSKVALLAEYYDPSLDFSRLIGRRSELEFFQQQLNDLCNEHMGRILFLRGVAGVGKTRLLNQIKQLIREKSLPLVSVEILPMQGEMFFALQFLQALSKLNAESSSRSTSFENSLPEKYQAVFDHLLAKSRTDRKSFVAIEGLSYQERIRIEDDLVGRLVRHYCQSPLVIIVDDIHWATDRAMGQLRHLGAMVKELPIVLIMASRLEEDPVSAEWRSGLLRTPFITLDLIPFNNEEALEFASLFPVQDHSYIEQAIIRSEGNPLFLHQLLTSYPDSVGCFPNSLQELLGEKLAELEVAERKFLQLAAALGLNFNINLLAGVLQTLELFPDVKVLIDRYLIRPLEDGEFGFCHSLLQQGICELLSAEEKQELHLCLADYFEHIDKQLYAHHLRLSNNYRAPLAALAAAEELVETYEYAEAIALVEQFLAKDELTERVPLLLLKGELLGKMDLAEKAICCYRQAVNLAHSSQDRFEAYMELALTYAGLQRFDEVSRTLAIAESIAPVSEKGKLELFKHRIESGERRQLVRYSEIKSEASMRSRLQDFYHNEIYPYEGLPPKAIANSNETSKRQQGISSRTQKGIKVGVLHSQTGILAELEEGVIQATLMAVGEINQKGGVLGRKIQPVLVDGKSCESGFIEGATALVNDPEIHTVFGCSSSSTRRSVKPIIEAADHLLMYPFQYEGIESSDHIFYTGPAPNQQALTAVEWLTRHYGCQRFFLVGSDYVYPSVINLVIKEQLEEWSVDIGGEAYVPLGGTDFDAAITSIEKSQPDVVVVTVVGLEGNKEFFKQLYERQALPKNAIVLSLVLSENDLSQIPIEHVEGIYTSFGYFQNNNSILNEQFVSRYRQCFGLDKKVGGYMESAYVGVNLWAQAVRNAESLDKAKLRAALRGSSFYGPGGFCYVDENNGHIWRHFYIAQVGADREFHTIWQSRHPIRPEPYPLGRSVAEWESTLYELRRWGSESWEKLA